MKKYIFFSFAILMLLAVAVAASDRLQWRMEILLLKAGGELKELTWTETLSWMLPDSPVYLDKLLTARNPSAALTNSRYVTLEDRLIGEEIYGQNCAGCHGLGGEGVNAPALNKPGSVTSDWDLYRTIGRGIKGTSMPAHDLPDPEIWQLMTYLVWLRDSAAGAEAGAVATQPPVTFERINSPLAESDNWLTYSGRYAGWRYSELTSITRENVVGLALQWAYQMDTNNKVVSTTPIVADGMMYITEPPGKVVALDAATGEVAWEYIRTPPENVVLCCGVVNRGVAVLGDTLFVATIDAHLLALDMNTGMLRWEVEVADHTMGYSITSAPLAVNGLVVTGVAGGEAGIRGFLDAYDMATGELVWRFYTVPEPGQPGSETWDSEEWKFGGVPPWMIGSYDPALGLIFWGTGHPSHDIETPPESRLDKLFGCSMLAIDASTGKLVWHYQFTPDDQHGFDAAQVPLLVDAVVEGRARKLLLTANRNGYYYVLDRETGEFILGTPFTKQTWANSLDENGRPIKNPDATPTKEGALVWPASVGGTNWWPPSFSPRTGNIYVPVMEMPSIYFSRDDDFEPGEHFVRVAGKQVRNQPVISLVKSLNSVTGEVVWERAFPPRYDIPRTGGTLSTSGDLLFVGNLRSLYALDIESGNTLWEVNTGGEINAAPMTFRANGEQFVTISAGRTIMTFGLPGGGLPGLGLPGMARNGKATSNLN